MITLGSDLWDAMIARGIEPEPVHIAADDVVPYHAESIPIDSVWYHATSLRCYSVLQAAIRSR